MSTFDERFPPVTAPIQAMSSPTGMVQQRYIQARRHAQEFHNTAREARMNAEQKMLELAEWHDALVKLGALS